jgi:hypothetical protein
LQTVTVNSILSVEKIYRFSIVFDGFKMVAFALLLSLKGLYSSQRKSDITANKARNV